MRLLVTRPEPDAASQAASLRRLGQEPVLSPLMRVEYFQPPLELYRAQAVVATSRNAVRAIAKLPQLGAIVKLPLFAVGEATANAAREAGFVEVIEGPGTAKALAALIGERLDAHRGSLIHAAGETLAFDLAAALEPAGFLVEAPVVYRSIAAKALEPEAARLLDLGALHGVVLMSPRTAQIFAHLMRNRVYGLAALYGFCLSPAVAANVEALGLKLRIAPSPREEELLALIAAEAPS
jgi:uroporphyrinogen-III synthase